MLLDLPLPLQILIFSFLFPTNYVAQAAFVNITVDDDNSSISYSSGWSTTNSSSPLDYGGYHHLSDQSNAFAEFTFEGNGIYYLSPLWPYSVQAQLMLDDRSPPILVDLQDHSQPFDPDGGPETVASSVVWGVGDLTSGKHTLRISFAEGEGKYVVLDALMYTEVDTAIEPTTSTTLPSTPSLPTGPSSTISELAASQSSQSPNTNSGANVPAIVGAIVGVVLALLGIGAAIYYVRNRRRVLKKYGSLIGVHYPNDDEEKGDPNAPVFDMVTPGSPQPSPGHSGGDSRSTLGQRSTSSIRQSLKRIPIFTRHKPLPELPPVPSSPTQSSSAADDLPLLNQKRLTGATTFFANRVGKRPQVPPPVVAVGGGPIRRTGTSSTVSSFFPAERYMNEDGELVRKQSAGALSRKSSGKSTFMAPVPNLPFDVQLEERREQRRRMAEAYVSQSPLPSQSSLHGRQLSVASSSSGKQDVVVQPPPRGASRTHLDNRHHPVPPPIRTDAVDQLPVVAVGPLSSPNSVSNLVRGKTATGLGPILEDAIVVPKTAGSGSSIRSRSSSKRRSGARVRLEREKSKKRLGRTTTSPRGPRARSPPTSRPSTMLSTMPSAPPTADLPPPPPSKAPLTPKTPGNRPLPSNPLSRRPSLSRGPHILVPLHLIQRLNAPVTPKTPNMVANIIKWQEAQLRAQTQSQSQPSPSTATQQSTTETSTFSSVSSLSQSVMALFPNPPQGTSLAPVVNTNDSRQQLLTPSPTIKKPSRRSSKETGAALKTGESMQFLDVPPPPLPSVATEPSAERRESLSAPSVVALSPPATAISPLSPRRPLPIPVPVFSPASGSSPSTNTSVPSTDPPPYSGRHFGSFTISPQSESEKTPGSKLPPTGVPRTPSQSSWSLSAIQSKLGTDSNPSTTDSTAANMLIELLDVHRSSTVSQQYSTLPALPHTPPASSVLPVHQAEPVTSLDPAPFERIGLPVTTSKPAPYERIGLPVQPAPRNLRVTKARPPALSVISSSGVESVDISSVPTTSDIRSQEASDTPLSINLPEIKPLTTLKRISAASVDTTKSSNKLPLFPPPTTPPPPLPSKPVQSPRIRSKVWKAEGSNVRGRALPFPVTSRSNPASGIDTPNSSEQSSQS